jgi:S1-C subfamily serine protease
VLQSGPASEAGIRPGDVVVRVADRPVTNTAELLTAVAALPPRSEASIGIQRGEQSLEVKVTVAQRPRIRREQ